MRQRHRNILIVDDDPAVCRLFHTLLSCNYTVREAVCGEETLDITRSWSPDLVLLDIMLPGIDGYEACRQLKALPVEHPPAVIMVSEKSEFSEQAKAFEVGADDYMVKPVDLAELRSRVELHFRLRKSQTNTAVLQQEVDSHNIALKRSTQERIEQTLAIQDVAVFTLAKVAESRDSETGEHTARMRDYSQILAKELGSSGPYRREIDETFLADLYRSSPLHDIGKVGISDEILLKPGQLTYEQFEIMKRHTTIGSKILYQAVTQLKGGGFLAMAATIAQFHHEWWDGTGYPAGLAGDHIPLPARIVSVADVYDALTSERPYKDAWEPTRAKQTIDEAAGTQFDPIVVAAFDHRFEDIVCTQLDYADRNPKVIDTRSFPEYDMCNAV